MDSDLRGNMIMKEAFEMMLTGAQRLQKIQMDKRLRTEMQGKYNEVQLHNNFSPQKAVFVVHSSRTLY